MREQTALKSRARLLRRKIIYRGRIITLTVERVCEPGGIDATREVVHHPGSVVVLARLPRGHLLLVRQYRHAAGQSLWELVAGGIEPGETPLQAARRELLEETGYVPQALAPLLEFFPSPGILSEKMHLIEARGLRRLKARPEADELLRPGRFTPAQLRKMVRQGGILDAKTLIGIGYFLG